MAFSCQGCNNFKYNKTEGYDPVSGEKTALYHPRQHQWNIHFAWNEDFTMLVGLTSIVRATLETLLLNREGVVNLRRLMYAAGEHPPVEPKQSVDEQ